MNMGTCLCEDHLRDSRYTFFGGPSRSRLHVGFPLREFVTEAVKDKLASEAKGSEKPWVKHMGKLHHLHKW